MVAVMERPTVTKEYREDIIDPNGGTGRTVVKTTRQEDPPPPVPDTTPVLAPRTVVPGEAAPALRGAGRNRRMPGSRVAVDPNG